MGGNEEDKIQTQYVVQQQHQTEMRKWWITWRCLFGCWPLLVHTKPQKKCKWPHSSLAWWGDAIGTVLLEGEGKHLCLCCHHIHTTHNYTLSTSSLQRTPSLLISPLCCIIKVGQQKQTHVPRLYYRDFEDSHCLDLQLTNNAYRSAQQCFHPLPAYTITG